jgi:hypothetical protein
MNYNTVLTYYVLYCVLFCISYNKKFEFFKLYFDYKRSEILITVSFEMLLVCSAFHNV